MEIEEVHPPHIYSIKYDDEDNNEFYRLFKKWNDVDYIYNFIYDNSKFLENKIWIRTSTPELATRKIIDEANGLEQLFKGLFDNTKKGIKPDFNSHFKYLEGKYKYEIEYSPMKSYSIFRPSLIRIYAIKMESNIYLITGGGIKLADTIQNSPDLKDHIIQNIDLIRSWLKENGIFDGDDLNE